MNKPEVSVLMSAYNASRFVDDAVASICSQTLTDWELVVVDDCSTDDTHAKLMKWCERDSRIHVLQTPVNTGVGGARDFGVSHLKARYVAIMDSDDVAFPQRLERQLSYLETHNETIAIGTQTIQIDVHGHEIGSKCFPTDADVLYELLYTAAPMQIPTLMIDRSKLPDGFRWFEGVPCAEDTLFFFKLLQFGRFANLPDVLQYYRVYGESVSARLSKRMFFETWRARRLGRLQYGYKATLRSRIISGLQFIVVGCVPNSLIPFIYFRVRRLMLRLSGQAVHSSKSQGETT